METRSQAGGAITARAVLGVIAVIVTLLIPSAASGFDPDLEAKNFAKTGERDQYVTSTPEFLARLQRANQTNLIEAAQIAANDPERDFSGNVCANGGNECAGDVRFYDWADEGFGLVKPVLFTARNGSTLSGRVWATRGGPQQRPLVVITTGSVQAPERLYWGQAATLASHGYVVLTYDVQGQGRSDTYGEGVDRNDGVPSQAGRPFFDNTEDALDFALSTPQHPYDPRPSCTTGTDHSPKQERRVEEGRNAAYNPLFDLVDPKRVGISGHSLGAAGVSYVGQIDDRVDAIAAWDNLSAPGNEFRGLVVECDSGSSPRPSEPAITKPGLGISNDYGITPTPNTSDPDPQTGNDGFIAYKAAGIDSMEVQIRGGTHEESAFIPGVTVPILGLASLRGTDIVAWYTTAWFDKYVKCDGRKKCTAAADRRLLTDRWRDDLRSGQIDGNDDANVFSFYKRSRYDLRRANGNEVRCDDMRAGCASMKPDGLPRGYDFVGDAYSPSNGATSGKACSLPQLGTNRRDTPQSLPPSKAGDSIRGRGGDDRLRGGKGRDCLFGGGGGDRLAGQDQADKLNGASGPDRLRGGAGSDQLRGGAGADRLAGGKGGDTIIAHAGHDRVIGGRGADLIRVNGGGRDRVRCGGGRDRVIADPSDLLAADCERIRLRAHLGRPGTTGAFADQAGG